MVGTLKDSRISWMARFTGTATGTRRRLTPGSLRALDACERARRPHADLVSAATFGRIKGLVRGLEELVPRSARLRERRDADRAGDGERAVRRREHRASELLANA